MTSFLRKLRPLRNASDVAVSLDEPGNQNGPVSNLGPRVVNPTLTTATIDIVFLHGLTGTRDGTWTANDASAPWPELLLIKDLPQARVITYGYDADVVNFWSMASQSRIAEHSQKFLTSIANLRDASGAHTRPLLFVVHSLGGIVCQDALLKSRGSADNHTRQILDCTRGIIFMGTPHCGAGLANWAVVGARFLQYFRQVNQGTLEVLKHKSEVMARVRQDFHTMMRDRDQRQQSTIKIVCFFEELPLRNIGLLVPQDSATLDRYPSIGIHANHIDMTKFSNAQDPDYQNVLSELRRFTQASLEDHDASTSSVLIHQYSRGQSPNSTLSRDERPGEQSARVDLPEQHIPVSTERPAQLVNHFSGSFNTDGGKMINGGVFNSGGGNMNF